MIVVFGSMNADLVLTVDRLPGPGETVLGPSYVVKHGGKGNNQAVAAARATKGTDVTVEMVGMVGNDDFGQDLVDNLTLNGVDSGAVGWSVVPTGVAFICVDQGGENFIAVASGANKEVRADNVPEDLLGPDTTLVMQMEVPPAQNWALAKRAKAARAKVILNMAPAFPAPPDVLELVDVLVVNRQEANAVAKTFGVVTETPEDLVRTLAEASHTQVVLTLGGDGAVAAEPDGKTWRIGVLPVTPVDTTGAGDTFVGVLAAALDAGADLPTALHRAGVAGAIACTALGAQESMPTGEAIDARLAGLAPPESF